MSKQLDWDAYRYVLDDPTLDRLAFEARMLDNVELALAVAEAMAHVDTLRAASFISTRSHHRQAVDQPHNWKLTSLAALSAALLLAIGLVNYGISHSSSNPVAQSGANEQHLAESWLAIRQTELVDVSTNLVDVSSNLEATRDDDALTESESTDDDWLLDAAREFYAQREAS